jgi:hypothetical protein
MSNIQDEINKLKTKIEVIEKLLNYIYQKNATKNCLSAEKNE